MSKLSVNLKKEIRELIPPTLFFFVALHLVAFISVLMRKGTGIAPVTSLSVTVAALLLGKAVLIADMLPFINRYPDKPLIYNVGWKTTIYVLVALVIHYLEHLLEFWRNTGSLRIANQKLLAEMVWHHFWAIQIILAMLIFAYCTVHELGRAFGAERMREIFFGSRTATKPLH